MTKPLTPAQLEARRKGGRARAAQASFKEAQRAGGRTRAAQPSFIDACRAGFAATMERHPGFARQLLRTKIRTFNYAKAAELGISYRTQRAHVRAAASRAESAALVVMQQVAYTKWVQGPAMPAGSLWG